jgi:fatty acid desaturase
MFLGAAVVAVIGFVLVAKGGADSDAEIDDERQIGRRWSTLLVFFFMFASGTLRALDVTGWIWIPMAVIAIGVTAASVIWHRRRG